MIINHWVQWGLAYFQTHPYEEWGRMRYRNSCAKIGQQWDSMSVLFWEDTGSKAARTALTVAAEFFWLMHEDAFCHCRTNHWQVEETVDMSCPQGMTAFYTYYTVQYKYIIYAHSVHDVITYMDILYITHIHTHTHTCVYIYIHT